MWEDADKLGCRLEHDMFSELSREEWQNLQNILDKVLHSLSAWKANQS